MISYSKLYPLGFKKIQPTHKEPEFMYDWLRLSKNNSVLEVTTEYDLKGKPTLQYFDFNGEKLEGKELTIKDIEFLKELM